MRLHWLHGMTFIFGESQRSEPTRFLLIQGTGPNSTKSGLISVVLTGTLNNKSCCYARMARSRSDTLLDLWNKINAMPSISSCFAQIIRKGCASLPLLQCRPPMERALHLPCGGRALSYLPATSKNAQRASTRNLWTSPSFSQDLQSSCLNRQEE